jgi:CheY-specific phosphatase CheX
VCLMIEQNFDLLISEVVDTVLETMFFTASLGPAEAVSDSQVLEARVSFQGIPSGTLSVRLSEGSARMLAAGFLGEDEHLLTGSESSQVVCELANMLCGMLMSKLETEGTFDLAAPELIAAGDQDDHCHEGLLAAQQTCALESGALTVTLHLGAVHDPGK